MTHEEAIETAAKALWADFGDFSESNKLVAFSDISALIAAYLEARGAVLCSSVPTAWVRAIAPVNTADGPGDWEADFVFGDDEPTPIAGQPFQPLHAALSDNPKGEAL